MHTLLIALGIFCPLHSSPMDVAVTAASTVTSSSAESRTGTLEIDGAVVESFRAATAEPAVLRLGASSNQVTFEVFDTRGALLGSLSGGRAHELVLIGNVLADGIVITVRNDSGADAGYVISVIRAV